MHNTQLRKPHVALWPPRTDPACTPFLHLRSAACPLGSDARACYLQVDADPPEVCAHLVTYNESGPVCRWSAEETQV